MRQLIITIALLLCITLPLAAQNDTIKVKYQGARPSISDFASAVVYIGEDCEDCDFGESLGAFANAWETKLKGNPLPENETISVDTKNGFLCYESRYEEHLLRVEMCYWNETDQQHKIFAYSITCYSNGKYSPGQYDGISFYRYNNATRQMVYDYDLGSGMVYSIEDREVSYSLPRTGKDITATIWQGSAKQEKTIKWTGKGFNWQSVRKLLPAEEQ